MSATDDELLEAYARHEAELEAGEYLRYRELLGGRSRGWARTSASSRRAARWRRSGRRWATGRRSRTRAEALAAPARALQARADHELRRRPVRALGQAAGRGLRLGDHRAAGAELQAEPRQLRARLRDDRRAARAHPARGPEPVPRPRDRQGARHDDGLDRPSRRAARGSGPRRPPRPRRTSTLPDMRSLARARRAVSEDDQRDADARGGDAARGALAAPNPAAPATRRNAPPGGITDPVVLDRARSCADRTRRCNGSLATRPGMQSDRPENERTSWRNRTPATRSSSST